MQHLFCCSAFTKKLQEVGGAYVNYFHFCMRDLRVYTTGWGDLIGLSHEYYANDAEGHQKKHLFYFIGAIRLHYYTHVADSLTWRCQ